MGSNELQYSFANDFAIADWRGVSAVKDTYRVAITEHSDNYKALTEIVITLNLLSWAHDKLRKQGYDGREKFIALYVELYYKAKDHFYNVFAENDEAKRWFWEMTD